MKGVYIVLFRLENAEDIEVGALGGISFEPGIYIYTGSGRNSVESRIERHFSAPDNTFWHIDYFSEKAEAVDYMVLPERSLYECVMADILAERGDPVDGFGSSDCGCQSHLFRVDPESF